MKIAALKRGAEPQAIHDLESIVLEEVLRTTNAVKLSYACHLLDDAGIAYFVADQFISAVEGSIGAFPRRLTVAYDDVSAARAVLRELASDGADGAT